MSIDDDAERMEALDRELCIKHRRQEVGHTGFCLECEEPTKTVTLANGEKLVGAFCDSDCRDTYQKRVNFNLGRE